MDHHAVTAAEQSMIRWFRTGVAVGMVVFLVVLTEGRPTILHWSPAGGYYDAQAESLLDGRLDIDPALLDIEGFESDGRTYMYQPPFPAVLRLPVAALTDAYQGRLGPLSMLLALLIAAAATGRILLAARRSMRADQFAGRVERSGAFVVGAVLAGGSVPVFLASRAWVYHESALWGMAWTLATLAALLGLRREPSWGRLALVGGAALCAVGSRASVGAGACAAIGLVAASTLVFDCSAPLRERLGRPDGTVPLLTAAAVPAFGYVALNLAKFGTVASIPFEGQAYTKLSPARQAMLEANDGTLFGLQFVPTTLLHYLRPAGVEWTSTFPFVDFRPPGGPVVGDVVFDAVDRAGSIPATLFALLLLGLAGVWAVVRGRTDDPWAWAAVVVGTAVGSATIIPFGYVAHRYLADAMPLLVVGATLGVQALAGAPRADMGDRRLGGLVVAGVAAVLVVASVWTNAGLATVYQRQYAPNVDPKLVAGLVDARLRVGDRPTVLQAEAVLPPAADTGDLAVVGDCEALYLWFGPDHGFVRPDGWIPVERTAAAGHVEVVVDPDDLRIGVRHALAVAPDAGPAVAWIRRDADGGIVAGIDRGDDRSVGRPVDPAGRTTFDVVLDPVVGEAAVRLGDEVLVRTLLFPRGLDIDPLVTGGSAGLPGYEAVTPGEVRRPAADLCRRVERTWAAGSRMRAWAAPVRTARRQRSAAGRRTSPGVTAS